MEMRRYYNILGISYKDNVTNEKVRSTIKHYIGPHEDLTTVKIRKFKWFGHVTRSCGLTKNILQGTVEGKRKRGSQRKPWTDNAEEWTGKPLAETQALAHDRNRWRRLCTATLQASRSGTFLQTRSDLVTPLKGHSLSPRSCPPTRLTPCERFGY